MTRGKSTVEELRDGFAFKVGEIFVILLFISRGKALFLWLIPAQTPVYLKITLRGAVGLFYFVLRGS